MSTPAPRSSAELAKAALRRLSIDQLEPTPENYARAYAQDAGRPAPVAEASAPLPLADWIERVVRGLERGGRHWTNARKKDSLQRVLSGSRSDLQRLQQRLGQLIGNWERDEPDGSPSDLDDEAAEAPTATQDQPVTPASSAAPAAMPTASASPVFAADPSADREAWNRLVGRLDETIHVALPPDDDAADALAAELSALTAQVQRDGADIDRAEALAEVCARADRVLQHRHHLVTQLTRLCEELTGSLTDLAEDDSWARGQCEAMRLTLDEGLTARGVKSVAGLLRVTRARQGRLRQEREQARDALKAFIHQMLGELGELGAQSGRFHDNVGRYADVIERADTLESLADVVRQMVAESRSVEGVFGQAQRRLQDEHARASALSERVNTLEGELRRLSDEVSTDQLTQVANRRGLMSAFDTERARQARSGGVLGVALLDVDNFKRLNDELGHTAGDEALKSLAALVARTLRPTWWRVTAARSSCCFCPTRRWRRRNWC